MIYFTQLVIVLNAILLTVIHCVASATAPSNETNVEVSSPLQNLISRLKTNGVTNMDVMDMVFFGCLILLGLELINISVKQAGRKYNRISLLFHHKYIDTCKSSHKSDSIVKACLSLIISQSEENIWMILVR